MNKNEERKHALLFIMRISLLQIVLTLSVISATFANHANGQEILDRKLSLDMEGKEIKAVLKTIAADLQIGFTYNNNIPVRQKVTVVAHEEKLGDVLTKIFLPLSISYTVIGNQVILKKSAPEMTVAENAAVQDAFRTVSGTVTGPDGVPLQGVSVSVAGSKKGTATDDRGFFQIQANTGDILVFSSVGFQETRIKVGEG